MKARIASWRKIIEPEWTSWCVVQHLLPRAGLLALSDVVIRRTTGKRLEDAFDLFVGDPEAGGLAIRARDPSPIPSPIRDLVRYLAWRNDRWEDLSALLSEKHASIEKPMLALLTLMNVGASRLEDVDEALDEAREFSAIWAPSTKVLIESLLSGVRGGTQPKLDRSLRAFARLHLAGMLARADRWDDAGAFAVAAQRDFAAWKSVRGIAPDAAALRGVTAGFVAQARAHKELRPSRVRPAVSATAALLINVNYGHDELERALTIGAREGKWGRPDRRAIAVEAPLLAASHDSVLTAEAEANEKPTRGIARIEATLRRQIGLGLDHDVQRTRAWLVRTLVREAKANHVDVSPLRRAMAELVLSGTPELANAIDWPQLRVADRLASEDFAVLRELAGRWPGVAERRQRTHVKMLSKVAAAISSGDSTAPMKIAEELLAYVGAPSSFEARINVGGEALDALAGIARARADVRRELGPGIGKAVAALITADHFWTTWRDAFNLARDVAEHLADTLGIVVDACLDFLAKRVKPEDGDWLSTRPALGFLGMPHVVARVRGTAHERQVLDTIVRFIVDQREPVDPTTLLLLGGWIPLLVSDRAFPELDKLIEKIASYSEDLRSSDAASAQTALVLAAHLAGPKALRRAVRAMTSALRVVGDDKEPPFSFSGESHTLLAVARAYDELKLHMARNELESLRQELADVLPRVWARAMREPLVLAGFAFPRPTQPNATLVHNLALATAAVADRFSLDVLHGTLESAARVDALAMPVQRAVAMYSTFRLGNASPTSAPALVDTTDGFYARVPFDVSALGDLRMAERQELVSRLVAGALRFGPSPGDGPIWTAAIVDGVEVPRREAR